MKLFAVTGNPILHSKSPQLFNAAYADRGDEFCYFRLHADTAQEAMKLFADLGLTGMNVTAPFKSDIVPLADHRSNTVVALNAANTVVKTEAGTSLHNTDVAGVQAAIGATIAGARCLVLGAGGAGCAAAYALLQAGGRVTLANRTVEKAQAFAATTGCAACGLENLAETVAYADILVNTLAADVVAPTWLTPQHTVLDAIYHSPSLRAKAEGIGATYIDGAQWLLQQGAPAYRRFTGVEPNLQAMQAALGEQFAPRHLSLIGFMGVGKSSVAKMLSQQLGMPCVDTDLLIEQQCHDTIANLIRQRGETYFRALEKDVIAEVLQRNEPTIISCGGGAITQSEVRRLLRQQSTVVWLYASAEFSIANIDDLGSRPLLSQGENPLATAKQLLAERLPLYAQAAWLLVHAQGKTTKQISQIIYDEVSKTLRG